MEVKSTCGFCGGTGFIDSDGMSPRSEEVNVPCPFCTGRKVKHANRGECLITDACRHLQRINPDKTSMFVLCDGEVIEVTKAMVTELDGSPVKV